MGIEAGVSEMVWVVVVWADSMYIQMYIAFDCMRLCVIDWKCIYIVRAERFYLHDNDDSEASKAMCQRKTR